MSKVKISEMLHSKCKSCGAKIIWIQTRRNKWIPVDYEPVFAKGGEKNVFRNDGKMYRSAPEGAEVYITHFATCPNAKEHRRKK